jgi:hypothetical protein
MMAFIDATMKIGQTSMGLQAMRLSALCEFP